MLFSISSCTPLPQQAWTGFFLQISFSQKAYWHTPRVEPKTRMQSASFLHCGSGAVGSGAVFCAVLLTLILLHALSKITAARRIPSVSLCRNLIHMQYEQAYLNIMVDKSSQQEVPCGLWKNINKFSSMI